VDQELSRRLGLFKPVWALTYYFGPNQILKNQSREHESSRRSLIIV